MRLPIVQCALKHGVRTHIPVEHTKVVCSEHNEPEHTDYGSIMHMSWRKHCGDIGLLWCEGDVAFEKLHLDEVAEYIDRYPGYVVAVPFRLYRASTNSDRIMWAHGIEIEEGRWYCPDADKPCPQFPASFGIGCTFLPAMLLNEATRYMDNWDHPVLDSKLSQLAHDNGIKCVTTPNPAVHLHY